MDYLVRILFIFLGLLVCTKAQIVVVPSTIVLGAGQCTNLSISRLAASADALSVTFNYNTGTGLTWNNASTGTSILTIPGGQTTSNTVQVCARNSLPSTTSTSISLSNSSYTVQGGVSQIPIQITQQNIAVPSGNLIIPRGGCSTAQSVTVSSIPASTLSLTLTQLANSGFYIRDARTSTNATAFSSSSASTTNSFYICSYYNNTSPLTLSPILTGASASQYVVNNGAGSTLTLSVGAVGGAASVSIVSTTQLNASTTDTLVGISTDAEGVLYYEVRDYEDNYPPLDPLNFTSIKSIADNNFREVRIHNQSDFLTYLNLNSRDLRINKTTIFPGTTQLLVDQPLLPGLNYIICQWFQSAGLSVITTVPCRNLSIPNRTWPIYQTAFQFTSQLNPQQRNNLLKWLYTNITAPSSSVVNLRGESANTNGGSPNRLWYIYKGDTNDTSNTQTLYVFTQDVGADSSYVTNLKNLFSGTSNTLGSNALNSITAVVGVTATSGQLIGAQPYMVMKNDTTRTMSTWTAAYYNTNVTVTNIAMFGGNGVGYFGLANSSVNVSAENLINCVDSSNSTPLTGCARVTLRSGQNGSVTFSNLNTNNASILRVYSTASNAYLIRPIIINSLTSSKSVNLGFNYVTTTPSNVTVAPGACQSINVSIGTWPYTNLTITGTPNNSNISLSNTVTVFNGQSLNPGVRVCAVSGSTTGNSTITWTFSGQNAADYNSTTTPVYIVNAVGDITVPSSSIIVPQGGCSSPFNITANALASQDVYLQAGNNTNYYFPNSTDGSYLHFNQSSLNNVFQSSICSYESSTTGPIPISVGGVQANVFTVNGGNTTILNVSQTSAPTPSMYFQANPIKYNDGTNVTISVVSNRQGWVYYALTEGYQNTSYWTLPYLRSQYSSGNYYVWNQSDFKTHIYTSARDARVNRTIVYAGVNNYVNHSDLWPGTLYTICGYYTDYNNSVTTSSANCSQFVTGGAQWPVYRAIFNFSRQLTAPERNRMLCYIAGIVSPLENRFLVNLRSESCNSSNSNPANEWYNYTGTTGGVAGSQVIYLMTRDNGTVSSAATNFLNMFDLLTNRTTVSVSSGVSSATGVTLNSGVYDGTIQLIQMKTSNRTASIRNAIGEGSTIQVNSISLNGGHGHIYFGLTNSTWPTVQQLLNCNSTGSNITFFNCTRLCIPRGETTSLTYNVGYANYIFYIATNDYPPRPINTTNNVSVLYIQRGIYGARAFVAGLAGLVLAVLIV